MSGSSSAELANAIRALAMDAVEAANSGHPGMPMGMAEIAVALWHRHLRHNPANPSWANRDRFVLSNGHGSMLLYALLHLSGYDLPIEQLKRFRRLGSSTPGHPEYGYAPGVETTTGPLGQGLANAVGMALAEKLLALEFNSERHTVVDHRTYVFLGDGCLMEGISHEVCSLAGTWQLNKLIALFDDNGISIDGKVQGWFTDDTPQRFKAYGWNVIDAVDGHSVDAVDHAIRSAHEQTDKPTLICCKTIIGRGAPSKQGSHECHGAPLGEKEVAAAREAIGWKHLPFEIPEQISLDWDARERGRLLEKAWRRDFENYALEHPRRASEFVCRMKGGLPEGFGAKANSALRDIAQRGETMATRKSSQMAIQWLSGELPELLGGSADLTGSNLTNWKGCLPVSPSRWGNYVQYGVREFGMAAIANGLSVHGGYRTFVGTFLMFSEYARNALRMAALMKLNPIFVLTHDSIGLGEDGPTHQPVEQTATLRMIPNMDVWRPCDAVETFAAWKVAIEHHSTPTCLILSRQALPHQPRDDGQIDLIERGGYVLRREAGKLALVLIATGSEVGLAAGAIERLREEGIHARLVSLPSPFTFDRQSKDYRVEVLPHGVPRLAVEAGVTDYWRKYVGLHGDVVGIDTFGESGSAQELYEHFGLTVDRVVSAAKALVSGINLAPTPA